MIAINWQPTHRQLRQFGAAFLVAGIVVGGVLWWRLGENLASQILWVVGPLAALVGWIAPRALKPVFLALSLAAYPIGMVVGTLALAATYYLLITPIGLFFRLIGRDLLHRRFEPDTASYWVERPPPAPPARYFRQF